VVLEGEGIARCHAVLTFADGRISLQDTSRGLGLRVNGRVASAAEVRSRDDVAIGPYLLKLRVLGSKIVAPEVPTEPEAPVPSEPVTPIVRQLATLPERPRAQVARPAPRPAPKAEPMALPIPPTPRRESDAPFGPPSLRVRIFWGTSLVAIHGFPFGRTVTTGPDESLDVPLYRFELPGERFELARSGAAGWTARVPKSLRAFRFEPGGWKAASGKACHDAVEVPLEMGKLVRIGDANFSLELRAEQIKRVPAAGFAEIRRSGAILPASTAFLMAAAMAVVIAFMPRYDGALPDFTPKDLPNGRIILIPPPPKVTVGNPGPKPRPPTIATPSPQPLTASPGPKTGLTKKGRDALDKVTSGSVVKQLLNAADKVHGGGKGNNGGFYTSPLIGRDPLIAAGSGFHMEGGWGAKTHGTGGMGNIGGPGGIGALPGSGTGHTGVKGAVVSGESNRMILKGPGVSIPRDVIAKIINSHLGEVRGCYERALIQDSGITGKLVLEWTIGGDGRVESIKVREQTLKNASVPNCVNDALRTWTFPAVGGRVIVNYPFMFNSLSF
jgi:hypothetical protein